jgi:hypothetical protein
LSFDVLRQHVHHPQSITHDNISYMRYGVHSNELLDKYFDYNPCTSAWTVRESNTQAEKSVVPLLEQEANSSGGLNYQGIFHPSITFLGGHWITTQRDENDIAHHLGLLGEAAHHIDGRRVGKLGNLVVERGNNAGRAGGQLGPPWVNYRAQDLLRNDDTYRLSVGKRHPDDECHVEVPSSKAPLVGRGEMGGLVTLKEK